MDATNKFGFSLTRYFYIGFFGAFIVLAAINFGSYFFSHVPEDPKARLPGAHEVGFPRPFWIVGRPYAQGSKSPNQDVLYPGFYWGRFLTDFAVVFVFSILAGDWYQKRRHQRMNQSEAHSDSPQ